MKIIKLMTEEAALCWPKPAREYWFLLNVFLCAASGSNCSSSGTLVCVAGTFHGTAGTQPVRTRADSHTITTALNTHQNV